MKLPSSLSVSAWRYVLGAVVFFSIAGYFFLGQGTSLGATLTITPSDFREQVSVSGTVIASRTVDLGFAANGRISSAGVSVGQHIEAGTILAEIENGDLSATLAQKQSALAEARANLAALIVGTRPEEIAVAATTVASASAALVHAVQSAYTSSDDAVHNRVDPFFINPRTNPKLSFAVTNATLQTLVERDRTAIETVLVNWAILIAKLHSSTIADAAKQAQPYLAQVTTLLADASLALNQSVPDQTTSAATLSSYSAALAVARANVNTVATTLAASAAALDTAQSTLALKQAGATKETLAAAEASVAAAVADVQNIQAQLVKTRVVAPFSGTLTRMDAKVGEIVSPTTSLISLQSDGIFEIETYIPEVTIAHVVTGNTATTTLDAYGPSVSFPSVVVAVDPAETVKDGVPTYKTTLAFLAKDTRIRSGMTTNVIIETGILPHAIVIPSGAVSTKDGVSHVSVIDRTTVVNKVVTTGVSPALGQSHILSGLSKGDVILLSPVL
jgi:HlyD family secretion protein